MELSEVQRRIEICNSNIKNYNLQIATILSEEPYSSEKFSALMKDIESTIEELQKLILSIE